MSQDLIDGVEIRLGTKAYTLPPCGFDTLEKHAELIDKHFGTSAKAKEKFDAEQIKLVIDLAYGALRLNYPDLERDTVARGITLQNVQSIVAAVLSLSLPAAPPGLVQGAGEGAEQQGATLLGESTGGSSAQP